MDQRRDEELLADHLAGKPGAFETLVSRYVDGLYSLFMRFVGNSAAADDLVQETFLQVHLAASTFDPTRSFKPWLFTIAANKARDYARGRSRRREQSLDVTLGDSDGPSAATHLKGPGPAAPEGLESEEQVERVRRTIAQMPEHLRLILILGYYQRLPYAQIAEILGIPEGTVKSRLHSAVSRFASMWLSPAETAPPET